MRRVRRQFLAAMVGGALVPLAPAGFAKERNDATVAARRLFDDYWEWMLRSYPEWAVMYFGEDRYPDRLRDESPAAVRERNVALVALRDRAARIDASRLSPVDRASLRVLRQKLGDEVAVNAHFRDLPFGLYEGPAPVTQLDGFHLMLPQLAQAARFATVRDYEAWLKRLQAVPASIDGLVRRMQAAMQAGWMPLKAAVERVPGQLDVQIVTDPKDSPEYAPFKAFPDDIAPPERQRLAAAAERVIAEQVVPAFRSLKQFYATQYLPMAKAAGGASQQPGGPAYYDALLAHHTTTAMSAREIHDLGLAEVARLGRAIEAIVAKTGFSGTRAEFQRHASSDDRFFHRSVDELLSGYRDLAKRADAELPKLFAELPRQTYGIRPMRPEEGDNPERYVSGSRKEGRPGWFEVNANNLRIRPKWEMETLLLHEAVPGHHLQTARAEERPLPRFRRHVWFTSYSEGWALYAESLGDEMGFYKDPYQKYGNLTYEMWRACRLVVDTGLHAFGWTREQAIDYMAEHTGQARDVIVAEVDRYLVWPGQATAYKIGELKIKSLRARAKAALGERFDVRRFHNRLLDDGALPLGVLEQVVDEWIAAERKAATARGR